MWHHIEGDEDAPQVAGALSFSLCSRVSLQRMSAVEIEPTSAHATITGKKFRNVEEIALARMLGDICDEGIG